MVNIIRCLNIYPSETYGRRRILGHSEWIRNSLPPFFSVQHKHTELIRSGEGNFRDSVGKKMQSIAFRP